MAAGNEIEVEDLTINVPESQAKDGIIIPIGTSLEEAEKTIILQNLQANKGNKSKTADVLKIGRKTLHRKLNEYGISTESEADFED